MTNGNCFRKLRPLSPACQARFEPFKQKKCFHQCVKVYPVMQMQMRHSHLQ